VHCARRQDAFRSQKLSARTKSGRSGWTTEQDAFVEKVIEAGEYQNASEAVRDALRALQQRRREDVLKLKALRTQIRIGVEALKRGELIEVADAAARHLNLPLLSRDIDIRRSGSSR
jgi:antitoxin ParD1/3/4